jgi:hypothetical protein
LYGFAKGLCVDIVEVPSRNNISVDWSTRSLSGLSGRCPSGGINMINVSDRPAPGDKRDESASSLVEKQWQIYRKMVDNNYLFHREGYGEPHRVLADDAVQPFRFLDIACGDASMTVTALRGTRIAHYHRIDLSQAARDLARRALAELSRRLEDRASARLHRAG